MRLLHCVTQMRCSTLFRNEARFANIGVSHLISASYLIGEATELCRRQTSFESRANNSKKPQILHPRLSLVGTVGIEPMTSCMSSMRSNQLSYAPLLYILYHSAAQLSTRNVAQNLAALYLCSLAFQQFMRV